jgi:hypothetical protein
MQGFTSFPFGGWMNSTLTGSMCIGIYLVTVDHVPRKRLPVCIRKLHSVLEQPVNPIFDDTAKHTRIQLVKVHLLLVEC